MILNIRVIPKAGRNLIKKENDSLKAYLTQPAYDGLANKQLIELLAGHLKARKSLRDNFIRFSVVWESVLYFPVP